MKRAGTTPARGICGILPACRRPGARGTPLSSPDSSRRERGAPASRNGGGCALRLRRARRRLACPLPRAPLRVILAATTRFRTFALSYFRTCDERYPGGGEHRRGLG